MRLWASTMVPRAVILRILNFLLVDGTNPLDVHYNITEVFFSDYLKLTDNLTKPALLKGFFNHKQFDGVCSCNASADLFDALELPYMEGNHHNEIFRAAVEHAHYKSGSIKGGDFFRHRACQGYDDYIFFDRYQGVDVDWRIWRFFHGPGGLSSKLRTQETVADSLYNDFYNEIYMGYSSVDFPLPSANRGGSAPHRAGVLNYYYQICGRKQWHIAHLNASLGHLDGYQKLVNETDMLAMMQHPLVYKGYTEPGDLLLNPPWLWHVVQTARGFNFAVAYKQLGFMWWSSLKEMDPVRAELNFGGLARALGQHTPHLAVVPEDNSGISTMVPGTELHTLHYRSKVLTTLLAQSVRSPAFFLGIWLREAQTRRTAAVVMLVPVLSLLIPTGGKR